MINKIKRLSIYSWFSFVMAISSTHVLAQSDDIDVAAAERAYQDQRQTASQWKDEVNSASAQVQSYAQAEAQAKNELASARQNEAQATRNLSSAQSDLDSAQNRILSAQADQRDASRRIESLQFEIYRLQEQVQSDRRRLAPINQEISDLNLRIIEAQRGENNEDWVCRAAKQPRDKHGAHIGVNADQEEAKNAAMIACREADYMDCEVIGCNRREKPEARNLIDLRDSKVRERDDLNYRISNTNDSITSQQNNIHQLQRNMDEAADREQRAYFDVNRAQNDISSAQGGIQDARQAIRMAEYNLSQASSALNQVQAQYNQTYKSYQSAEASMQEFWDYLQAVRANYQRAQNQAIADAQARAQNDGAYEGNERGPSAGQNDGGSLGTKAGKQKGEQDAQARDEVRGYLAGRRDGAANTEWRPAYDKGTQKGAALALEKARKESLPKGFQDRLAELMRDVSTNEATINMFEAATSPGEVGNVDLSNASRAIGQMAAPQFPLPSEQTTVPPKAPASSPTVPATDWRYAQQNCEHQRRPEFVALCQKAYNEAYASSYANAYVSSYSKQFGPSYNQAATDAYRSAMDAGSSTAFAKGATRGAEEQGVLDSFTTALADAQTQQYAQGRAELEAMQGNAYLPILRSSSLTEVGNDGFFAGGERLSLNLVIDNVAGMATPSDKLRVVITGSKNINTISHTTRNLPSLAGETSTSLLNVVTGYVAYETPGTEIEMTGQVEIKDSQDSYRVLSTFKVRAEVHYPLEVTKMDYPGRFTVDQAKTISVTYTNRSANAMPAQKVTVTATPVHATVKSPVDLPALEPGASHTVDITVTPNLWASENVKVHFLHKVETTDGSAEAKTIAFDRMVYVNRAATLMLYNEKGEAVPRGIVRVKAGQVAKFNVDFRYLWQQFRPGPFVFQVLKSSDPRVTVAAGGTSAINFGSWGPGNGDRRIEMRYNIPADLKGKKIWVAAQILEGNVPIHNLQVYLDVE